MTPDEVEAALQSAFRECAAAGCPLTDMQKQILLQVLEQVQENFSTGVLDPANPLDELTSEELEALLQFVKSQQEQNNGAWKVRLMNDWLLEQDSGQVQFIRDRYGLQWLNRVESYHFEQYSLIEDAVKLRVGDRIEVCNALWEWVQDQGPCQREWFPCMVIQVNEVNNGAGKTTSCTIRFYNGTEYEIQGVYEWNRYNWRWTQR
ncbi:MAG TPA: hypothetical protein VK203_03060 [Nostocaceae cyanobacterium]|nr:hypothetical protein [Nostocaceae cyanobacterium]